MINKLRVMVVDDTILYRKVVSDVLATFPDVEVVGTASSGKIAVSRLPILKPDFITLDIEMPDMNGIEVLKYLQKNMPDVGAVMLSTLTQEGSDMTIRALELGAFDFIPKPQSGTLHENTKYILDSLTPIVKAFKRQLEIKAILGRKPGTSRPSPVSSPAPSSARSIQQAVKSPEPSPATGIMDRMNRISRPLSGSASSELVAIGISTGGPNALSRMMPMLPEDIGVPIVIVQHMPPLFTQSLAKSLDAKCSIKVKEASDGDVLTPGTALIAPGGKQMKIIAAADGRNRIIKITDDPPENSCRPSADYLFRSVAEHYISRSTGVIMTGMGSDGTAGLRAMKKNGGIIIAQNEATCTVYGMPKEPVESGIADIVAPLDSIAGEILKTIKRSKQ